MSSEPVFIVVVMTLAGTVASTVGPFWDEKSARAWGERNVIRRNYAYVVRPLTERGIWLAEHELGT